MKYGSIKGSTGVKWVSFGLNGQLIWINFVKIFVQGFPLARMA